MPTYEYRCPEGHEFEDFVLKISDAKSDLPCPTCGQVAGRRMSAGSGLLFKGSGFYITDYGKDGKKDQRAAAKVGEGSGGSSTSGDAASSAPAAGAKPAGGAAASDKPAAAKPASAAPASSSSNPPKSGPAK